MKADPDSSSMRRLEAASNAVRKATDNLVKAAQQALDREEENGAGVDLNKSAVNSVVEVKKGHVSTHSQSRCTNNCPFRKSMREARCSGWSASWSRREGGWRSCTRGATRPTRRRSNLGERGQTEKNRKGLWT